MKYTILPRYGHWIVENGDYHFQEEKLVFLLSKGKMPKKGTVAKPPKFPSMYECTCNGRCSCGDAQRTDDAFRCAVREGRW